MHVTRGNAKTRKAQTEAEHLEEFQRKPAHTKLYSQVDRQRSPTTDEVAAASIESLDPRSKPAKAGDWD